MYGRCCNHDGSVSKTASLRSVHFWAWKWLRCFGLHPRYGAGRGIHIERFSAPWLWIRALTCPGHAGKYWVNWVGSKIYIYILYIPTTLAFDTSKCRRAVAVYRMWSSQLTTIVYCCYDTIFCSVIALALWTCSSRQWLRQVHLFWDCLGVGVLLLVNPWLKSYTIGISLR